MSPRPEDYNARVPIFGRSTRPVQKGSCVIALLARQVGFFFAPCPMRAGEASNSFPFFRKVTLNDKTLRLLWPSDSFHQKRFGRLGVRRFIWKIASMLKPTRSCIGVDTGREGASRNGAKEPTLGQRWPSSSSGDLSSPSKTIKRSMGSPGQRQTPFIGGDLYRRALVRARVNFLRQMQGRLPAGPHCEAFG